MIEQVINGLISEGGVLALLVVGLGAAVYWMQSKLHASQESRVADAQAVAAKILEVADRSNASRQEMAAALREQAEVLGDVLVELRSRPMVPQQQHHAPPPPAPSAFGTTRKY